LREASVQIEHVVRRRAVHGLREAVSESVVGVRRQSRPLCDARQSIRGVIRVRARAIVQQIAVVVPGVRLPVHAGEAVGGIVSVRVRDGCAARQEDALLFGESVPHRVVCVTEVTPVRVVRFLEAIQRVIDVADGRGHHRAGHRANVRAAARLEGIKVQRAIRGRVHTGYCAKSHAVNAARAVVEAGQCCL